MQKFSSVKMIYSIYFYLSLVLLQAKASDMNFNDGTVVEIESGYVRGRIAQSGNGNNFWSFQEIPYAAPPVRHNRYLLPKPPVAWNGVINTTKNTKICYQGHYRFPDLEISEDCLYINVYTPVKPGSNESLPVLAYIHGGGYTGGSGAYERCSPKYIMDYEIVVVTFNYRLGAFGFLGTEDGVIAPNIGFEDQKFALKWIQRNIKHFCGNNKKVTIVGESAGSSAVGRHLIGAWMHNEELFQGAIQQSGSPIAGVGFTDRNLTEIAVEMAQRIDPTFKPSNTTDLLKFLQQVDAKDILKYGTHELSINKPDSTGVYQNFLNGNYKKVPVLMGFNSEESLSSQFRINDTILAQIDEDPSILIPVSVNMSPGNRSIAGRLLKNIYTKNTSFVNYKAGFIRHNSDSGFVIPMCKQAEISSVHVPYYLYQFSYKGQLGGRMNVRPLDGTGAVVHAENDNYMWEEVGFNSDISKFPEPDQLAMKRFLKLWTNFVKYYDPTPEDDPLLGNIRWRSTDAKTLRYLNFNKTLEMMVNPRQYQEVNSVLETYMEPPLWYFN